MNLQKPPKVRYLVRTTAGTEELAWLDIQRLPSTRHVATGRRRVEFEYSGAPEGLLALRSVDDVYVSAGRLQNLDRSRLSLQHIAQQISALPLSAAIQVCQRARFISKHPSYAVTASLLGQRNYSRYDVAEAIRDGLRSHYDWTYVDHRTNTLPADLDLRVLIEGDEGYVGFRLGQRPLHRRPYKVRNRPGSLKPPVAYLMALLARVQSGDAVFDPMCGVGTIPIETATAFDAGTVWGLDIDAAAIRDAVCNAQEVEARARFMTGDVARLPLPDDGLDCIVCNLPWGRQTHVGTSLRRTYAAAVGGFSRVLRPEGRAVLLTDRTGLLLQNAASWTDLHLTFARQISLFGSHPTICLLTKRPGAPDLLHPFQDTEPLAQGLNELVHQFAVENLSHPDFRIRLHAIRTCARSQDPQVLPSLQQLLDDEDGRIRRAALTALDQIQTFGGG